VNAAFVIGAANAAMARDFARQYQGYIRMNMPARAAAAARAFTDAAGVGIGQWVTPKGKRTTSQRQAMEAWAR
jgi:hypothetical protein